MDKHRKDRAFYDMSGEKNYYGYMTTEKKQDGGKAFTYLDYMQKQRTSRVFNQNGMIPLREVDEMKKRAQSGDKQIWHGYVSVDEENSCKINTPEKCIRLVQATFPRFLKDMGLSVKDVDMMCALHTDRSHHLHVHFCFWEKEPKVKYREKELQYRHKGKIAQPVIADMKLRLNLALKNTELTDYRTRDEAIRELKAMTAFRNLYTNDDVREELITLAKALPRGTRLFYGNKEAEPYRKQVDHIVMLCHHTNKTAANADKRFYERLAILEKEINEICGKDSQQRTGMRESGEKLIRELEWDYRCRKGNVVLQTAQNIKPELFKRNERIRYKSNSKYLKRRYAISNKKVSGLFHAFINSFGGESQLLERDYCNRLQEIEEEFERQHESEKQKETDNYNQMSK